MHAATQGRIKIKAVIGGPNCRTWSICLHMPKPGGGIPLRGRSEDEVWGLLSNSTSDQKKVDDDSTLLLRMWCIYEEAAEHSKIQPAFLFEHPTDPATCNKHPAANKCSSIWATKIAKAMLQKHTLKTRTFNQCRLGQIVAKTTTIAIDENRDADPINTWDKLQCNHEDKHREVKTHRRLADGHGA